MRITYLEHSSFCVQLKELLVGDIAIATGKSEEQLYCFNRRRQTVLLHFVRAFDRFDSYFINDERHDTFQGFVTAIRLNQVEPTRPVDDANY